MGSRIDYQTVDVPINSLGRADIDVVTSMYEQEGWRPVALISPLATYPHYSILFERQSEVTDE